MRIIYETWAYFCRSCGRKAKGWDARVPATHDANKCGPTTCGFCNGRGFRAEKVEQAA